MIAFAIIIIFVSAAIAGIAGFLLLAVKKQQSRKPIVRAKNAVIVTCVLHCPYCGHITKKNTDLANFKNDKKKIFCDNCYCRAQDFVTMSQETEAKTLCK